MVYKMGERELELQAMRLANIRRKNAAPAVEMKRDMGKTVDRPALIAVVKPKPAAKKKKTAKSSRKRG